MLGDKSILVVDDDEAILESNKAILEQEGYRVSTAETGLEALRQVNSSFFNLVLLDIRLQDLDGTELLKKIHENYPVMMKVMVTGFPDVRNAVDSLNFGANAYLVKPIDPQKLLEVIKDKLVEQEKREEMDREQALKWIEKRVQQFRNGRA